MPFLQRPHGLYNFPKAELHCHLDGTYNLESVIEMAKERGTELPTYDVIILARMLCNFERCESLDEYLEIFTVLSPVFAGSVKNLTRLAKEAVLIKAKFDCRYIELRYSPHLFLDKTLAPDVGLDDVVTAIHAGFEAGMTEVMATTGVRIVVRTVLCSIISHPEWSLETAELCLKHIDHGVVGFDVAGCGDEEGKMILQHKPAYDFCVEHNIGRTAHAGEKGSSQEVKVAVEQLHVQRIGHGYKVVNDDQLFQECIAKRIHFEVCPLSSYLTASVSTDLTKHPARQFLRNDLAFSLNTDDPGAQKSCLDDEYYIASTSFGMSTQEMQKTNIEALKAAFVDEATKNSLIAEFEKCYRFENEDAQPTTCTAF